MTERPPPSLPSASSHQVHHEPPGIPISLHLSALGLRVVYIEAGQVGRAAICQLPFSTVQGLPGNTEHIKGEVSSSLQHFWGKKPLGWCNCAQGTLDPRE